MEQEREVLEGAADRGRESGVERGRVINRGTMRGSPEYQEQKMDAEQAHTVGGGGEKKGLFSRAKDKLLA